VPFIGYLNTWRENEYQKMNPGASLPLEEYLNVSDDGAATLKGMASKKNSYRSKAMERIDFRILGNNNCVSIFTVQSPRKLGSLIFVYL